METTEAVKLWLSPESVFERASETGTQNKQSKEKKYGTDFHTRYKGENTANHLPPFCKKWKSMQNLKHILHENRNFMFNDKDKKNKA